ncbi:MAG: folate family ECF transporter S component [Clostridia bacterium]|nr:folate family ECF transporter S component [Clostridia bacterium]
MKRFSVRYLAVTGMLVAVSAVLASNYCTFYITPAIRISFRDIPVIFASIYCGPLAGLICGVCADLLGTLVSGLGFYPLITISAALIGLLPGLICRLGFKKHPFGFISIVTGVFACNILANIGWTTLSLKWLYGMNFWVLLSVRLPQYLIMACVESYLIFLLVRTLNRVYCDRMSYEETLNYIHTINWRGSKLGLSRTIELLKLLHNPEKKLRFVHIAGTNGKGSTAAMTASILREQGYKTGLFVSPYVVRFNERMQINGEHISDSELARIVSKVKPYAESMKVPPTEFELITAVAFTYFFEHSCDIVVLEVGLGGELDSTNVIDTPEAAAITAIGYDHTRILGDSIEKIAEAKAGIIKDGGEVVFYGTDEAAMPVIREACERHKAVLSVPEFDKLSLHSYDVNGQSFSYKERNNLWLPLIGEYQTRNAALVLEVVEALKRRGWEISEEAVYIGLHNVRIPARFEVLSRAPVFIVDGGHNPMGVDGSMRTAERLFPGRKFRVIMGVMADKDVDSILRRVVPQTERFYAVAPDNPRAMEAEELSRRACELGAAASPFETVEAAVRAALFEAGSEDIILALGSLYMAGDIREFIFERNKEERDGKAVDGH